MALSFSRFSWLWLGGKEKEQVSNGSLINSINSLGDWGVGLRGEPESLKFYSVKGVDRRMPSSSSNRKAKRKWKSREERSRRIDKEYDVVLVPSDGVCLSGSESDDSDWSIGWLEPHAPDFQSDDEADDSLLCWFLAIGMNLKKIFRSVKLVFVMGKKKNPIRRLLYQNVELFPDFKSHMAQSTWSSGSPPSVIFEVTISLSSADYWYMGLSSTVA
ncbi:hypothetical protein Sango_1866800 [Sesamum angolense]|uniref:Uncharacterized protein n=1 Tax=Sesamum angolense TaxID=2727404 RepID=A0AAE1WIE6_9LAMI|nr:hypothetical protein Sango_1866800 [Sesamum angolense]